MELNAQPKFFKSRTIPFAYFDGIKDEIQRNINAGINERMDKSKWAAPIVHIYSEFKVTINSQIWIDQYSILTIAEFLTRMNNRIISTKLDLSDAYLQIELDDTNKKLVVIDTCMGLFKYN